MTALDNPCSTCNKPRRTTVQTICQDPHHPAASSSSSASPPSSNGSNSNKQKQQQQQQQQQQQPQTTKSLKPSLPPSKSSTSISGYESIIRFLSLPRQVGIVLLLEFLNSFRIFGLRFVLYNYITNEYGISDTYAGQLLGIKGIVDIFFGMIGSILVDIIGVRHVSVFALLIAIVGRSLLTFGRSTTTLIFALLFFSPCGEAMLSMGLYRVALKKLTTPLTRPLAFAVSYAASHLSGALADVMVDRMRRSGVGDLEVDGRIFILGGVYTPTRQFILVTWVVLLFTFVIAYCYLRDETVIDTDDPDKNNNVHTSIHTPPTQQSINDDEEYNGNIDVDDDDDDDDDTLFIDEYEENTIVPSAIHYPSHDAIPSRPMVSPRMLRKLFPQQFLHQHSPEDEEALEHHQQQQQLSSLPNYKVYKTIHSNKNTMNNNNSTTSFTSTCWIGNPLNGIFHILKQIAKIASMRNTWQALLFGISCCTIAMQWTASEMVLPPFLERRYGEHIAIYSIQSINLFGDVILPPIVGAFTTGIEDFQIVMPGLWIMAFSPLFVAIFPNVFGACMWQLMMTVGEVLWGPRQDSWTAGLAPTGMEGLFFAIGSARSLLAPVADMAMGVMNARYNTNCPQCRDDYGHFCQHVSVNDDVFQCISIQESCDLFFTISENEEPSCPKTCLECPTWEATNPSTFWYILIVFSVSSPLAVWFFLPFLRGQHTRSDGCYGVFKMSTRRVLGIFGAREDFRVTYDYIDESEMLESHDHGLSAKA